MNKKPIIQILMRRMKKIVFELGLLSSYRSYMIDSRLNETIASIVFSTNALNSKDTADQRRLRVQYFEATFLSIYRYIPNIVVVVGNKFDKTLIEAMKLPYFSLIDLAEIGILPLNDLRPNLPKWSLINLINMLQYRNTYSRFNYVYHTEADELLHFRSVSGIFDSIDYTNGSVMLVPHRMQVLSY